ncbi:hypothetical protein PIB30_106840, partial [Stylosanthes scabra]|nr:hypothetical protein [Stylosanthes scabra]
MNEEECGGVCFEMFDLSEGEDRTPEAFWTPATTCNTTVEMGRYYHGFRYGIAKNFFRTRYHLGYSGSSNE